MHSTIWLTAPGAIIGYRKNGTPIRPIADGPGDGGGGEGQDGGTGSGTTGGGTSNDGSGGGGSGDQQPANGATSSDGDRRRWRRRRQRPDREGHRGHQGRLQARALPAAAAREGPGGAQGLAGTGHQGHRGPRPQQSSDSTALGVIVALIVLGLAFGALFAAITPIVTALVAIVIGYDITGLLSHALTIVSFAPILGVLIGLGVGGDYALFIVTRHRSAVLAGRSIEDAAVNAVSTAGRAVLFAGLTVAIALLGQFAVGSRSCTARRLRRRSPSC